MPQQPCRYNRAQEDLGESICCKLIGIQLLQLLQHQNQTMQATKVKYWMNKDQIATHILICARPNTTVAAVAVPVRELEER